MTTHRHRGLATAARLALGLGLVLVSVGGTAFAGVPTTPVPELDAGSMLSAVTLLTGGLLIATNRIRRK